MINSNFMNNAKTWVSPKRIKQLRSIVKDTKVSLKWDIYSDDRDDLIRQNKEASRAEIADILENPENKINKTEAKKLSIFLKNYISSLTKDEYVHLHKTMDSILEYNAALYPMMEEYFNYHKSYDSILFDSLLKLISEKMLLSKTEKQEEFNEEFKSILYRYYNTTIKKTKALPFFIAPINTNQLITYMQERELYNFSDSIELDWWANLFSYKIKLRDMKNNEPFNKFDELMYRISIWKTGWNGISRDEVYDYIESEYIKISNNVFYIEWDRDFNVNIEVRPRIVNDWLSWKIEDMKETFDIEFFIYPKKEMNTYEYFDKASQTLSEVTQKFMSRFYRIFDVYPDVTNFINIDPDEIYDKIADIDECDEDSSKTMQTSTSWGKDRINNSIINSKYQELISSIDDMILENSEKKELKKIINMFNNPDLFKEYWLEMPKWMILYWPPWVWKTLFLKIFAKQTDATFIHISHSDIETKWVWESEKNIKAKFNEARKLVAEWKKVILSFDEWDSLFEARWEEKNYKEWIIAVILGELDWFDESGIKNIFTVILTNRPEAVDNALKERLSRKIWLKLPSLSQRVEHLKLNIKNIESKSLKTYFDESIDFDLIAIKLNQKSGRFIKNLIYNTAESFVNDILEWEVREKIATEDIIQAIKYTKENEEETKDKVMWFWINNEK